MLRNLQRALAPIALAMSLVFAAGTAAAHDDDGYYADTANLPDQSKWMARVPDATKVVRMSIPGTHDSGSRYGADPFLTPLLSITQTLTIRQQLNAGIRFLDVRVRHVDNRLAIHHGPIYQHAMFGDVIAEAVAFLAANPSETVLMRVKREHTEERITRSYRDTLREYVELNHRWFATPPERGGSLDPTLGEVRGKILLLVDTSNTSWPIDWGDNGGSSNGGSSGGVEVNPPQYPPIVSDRPTWVLEDRDVTHVGLLAYDGGGLAAAPRAPATDFLAPIAWDAPLGAVTASQATHAGDPLKPIVYVPYVADLGLDYAATFNRVQDDWALYQPSDLHAKWLKAKAHLAAAERDGAGYINYLSGSMGGNILIFPYFVASGHSSMGTGAPRLPTGLTTPGWEGHFPEFPRVNCFVGICTIAYEGTNTLAKDYIHRTRPLYTGIVVADFPGAGLIRNVIETNFRAMTLLSETNGLCLDVEGGALPGRRLISYRCNNGTNQQIRFDGERLMVGGMCLGVHGTNRHKAPVHLFACNGSQHQKWRMHANGTIESLLAGDRRCLDLAVEDGGAISMQGCWPTSSDQRFWHPSRFPVQLLVNEASNKCADIKGGVGMDHRLIVWPCTGNWNQKFRFDGERILVGDLCLDVRGNKNVHQAEVVAYKCNGGANQNWFLNANGTIQSRMPGEARCLDLATEHGNAIRIQTCWPSSPDQRFLRVPL